MRKGMDRRGKDVQRDKEEGEMDMRELMERGFLAGIGALSLTREKVQALVDDLVKRGEIRRDEAKGLADRLVKRGEEEREVLRKLVRDEAERVLGAVSLATKEDIAALSKKIETLAKRSGQ